MSDAVECRVGQKTEFKADGELVGEVFEQEGQWMGRFYAAGFSKSGWGQKLHPSEAAALDAVRYFMRAKSWLSG